MKVSPQIAVLSVLILVFSAIQPLWSQTDSSGWQREQAAAYKSADKALMQIRAILSELTEEDFSAEAADEDYRIDRAKVEAGTPRIEGLRQTILPLIAKVDLAQDYPATEYTSYHTLEQLTAGKDYFGVSPTRAPAEVERRRGLIEKLFQDPELQLGDRLFGWMQTGKESADDGFLKWLKFVERLSEPYYFGADLDSHSLTVGRSLAVLTILRGVTEGATFQKYLESSDNESKYQRVMAESLQPALVGFAESRFRDGGMLRDWSLPVKSAAELWFPEIKGKLKVTSHSEYTKSALATARAVHAITLAIDADEASPAVLKDGLESILAYRSKPYYIGAMEVRESGTPRVAPDGELTHILSEANFFGSDDVPEIELYREKSDFLDSLFLAENSEEIVASLVALQSAQEWLDYFEERIFGGNPVTESALFPYLEKERHFTVDHLKDVFLARLLLPSSAMADAVQAANSNNTAKSYETMLGRLASKTKQAALYQYRNYPDEWVAIEMVFLELSKGFESLSFDEIGVTSASDLTIMRREFEEALYGPESVASQLYSLLSSGSTDTVLELDALVTSRYGRRSGRFDRRLTPHFAGAVNDTLHDLLDYRNFEQASIDTLERPDMVNGRIMSLFAVSDYRVPEGIETNTLMHDLLCGKDGGFGGLGRLISVDSSSYRKRESALDAIASSQQLELGEVLFQLATDVRRDGVQSKDDSARAAMRWLDFFRKSQANAQYHPVPEMLRQAVRGVYLSRMVFDSESFKKAVEESRSAEPDSGLAVSQELESVVAAQVRRMQALLGKIDPETAMNRNIEDTIESWQRVKVWYIESNKWLETIIDEPTLMDEIVRIRDLQEKETSYQHACPDVMSFRKDLTQVSRAIHTGGQPATLGFAKFAMEQVIELEPRLDESLPALEGDPIEVAQRNRQLEFGREVTDRFFQEVRAGISEAGYPELAGATSQEHVKIAIERLMPAEIDAKTSYPSEVRDRAISLEQALKAAVARAISRVQVDQPTDFRNLAQQSVRASKIDNVFTQQSGGGLTIQPSFVLQDWIDRERVEIMTEYRTAEVTSIARQTLAQAKLDQRTADKQQKEIDAAKIEIEAKSEMLQEWIDKVEGGTSVEVVLGDMVAMRQELTDLRREVSQLRDSEAVIRSRAVELSQQLHQTKLAGSTPEELNPSSTEEAANSAAGPTETVAQTAATWKKPTTTYKPKTTTYKKPTTKKTVKKPAPKKPANFFQRIFGRR